MDDVVVAVVVVEDVVDVIDAVGDSDVDDGLTSV